MAIKKRRRVRLNSSPAGRPGRHSMTPVKGKKKAAVSKPKPGAPSTGGPGKFPGKDKYKPPSAPAPGYFRGSKPPKFAPTPAAKPKPKVKRKPRTRKATTRQRRA